MFIFLYFLKNSAFKEFYFKELRINKNICLNGYEEKTHTENVKCLELTKTRIIALAKSTLKITRKGILYKF